MHKFKPLNDYIFWKTFGEKSDKKPKKQQNKPSDSYKQMSLEGVIG